MKKEIVLVLFVFLLFYSCKNKEKQNTVNQEARNKIINASEINKKIRNEENIVYKDATIIGDINFLNSEDFNLETPFLQKYHINSSILFHNCTFKGKVIARKQENEIYKVSNFNKNVTFISCTFQDTVNFTSSDFNELVNFSESEFQEFVSFEACAFNFKKNYFSKVHFQKAAMFNLMFANGDMNFFETIFDDNVLFQLSKFNNPVHFGASKFNKNADFTNVKFFDDVFFNYSEFIKKVNFNNSVFRGRTEFIKTKFNFISEFKDCVFFGKTTYNNSEIIGVFTFKNSVFYISDPEKFNCNIKKGSDYIIENTKYIIVEK
ncbi:MAG: hypothetical protein L3J35_11155 [Bacteroidales bacterium]|nr:hypothetical protein [Bacteroidales bacterium]